MLVGRWAGGAGGGGGGGVKVLTGTQVPGTMGYRYAPLAPCQRKCLLYAGLSFSIGDCQVAAQIPSCCGRVTGLGFLPIFA